MGGVKFNEEEEERCPKTSPLTLARVLKAPIESEEGERRVKPTKKRNRIETEEQRDQAPTIVFDEGDNSERGGFHANLEQLMLSHAHQLKLELRKEEKKEKVTRAQVQSNYLH